MKVRKNKAEMIKQMRRKVMQQKKENKQKKR